LQKGRPVSVLLAQSRVSNVNWGAVRQVERVQITEALQRNSILKSDEKNGCTDGLGLLA
jgi:hypothetical protein